MTDQGFKMFCFVLVSFKYPYIQYDFECITIRRSVKWTNTSIDWSEHIPEIATGLHLVIFDAGHICVCHCSKNMLPTHSESDGPIHLNIGFVFSPFYLVLVSKSLSISLALTFFFKPKGERTTRQCVHCQHPVVALTG